MKSYNLLHDMDRSQANNQRTAQQVDVTRRKFLAASAVGAVGLGAVGSATAAPDKHTLVIGGTGTYTSYSFTVGGNLQKSTTDGAGIDSKDEIIGQSAHGAVTSGKDAYTFTGPLYSFDFDRSGAVDVDLDGEAARVGDRPDRTLLIEGFGGRTNYSFSTRGPIEKSDAYGASTSSEDRVNSWGAAGAVSGGGKDAYTFDRELDAFEFDQDGSIRVTIDGKAAHVGQLPDYGMVVFTDREDQFADYEVRVSGSIREKIYDDQRGDNTKDVGGNVITDSVWGGAGDKFTFDGKIEMFESDNLDALEVYYNSHKYL